MNNSICYDANPSSKFDLKTRHAHFEWHQMSSNKIQLSEGKIVNARSNGYSNKTCSDGENKDKQQRTQASVYDVDTYKLYKIVRKIVFSFSDAKLTAFH